MAGQILKLPRPIVWVLLALAVLFALDLFALAAYREAEIAADKLMRQAGVLDQLQALPKMAAEMQSGMRGYLLGGSTVSLERYRAAADAFPDEIGKAIAAAGDDAGPRKALEAVATSMREWLELQASPLVIKRGADDTGRPDVGAVSSSVRKAEIRMGRITAQLDEALTAQRDRVALARGELKHRLDAVGSWTRSRAFALLLALAAMTVVLGRTLARLSGQTQSREIAENAMRMSSATLRAMSEAAPLGMLLADGNGACVQTNQTFERMTGLPGSAMLGGGWQSALHPDDRLRVAEAWSAAIASRAAFHSVHRFVQRNGKVVWASMKSAAMSDGERTTGYVCSIEDVSERRQAEEALRKSDERLHLALENSGLALFDWHIPSGEVFLSREWLALTGYDPRATTTTARRINDLIHPSDREPLREAIIAALKGNLPTANLEYRIETRSGQWKRLRCRGDVIERDATARAVRLAGTITAAD